MLQIRIATWDDYKDVRDFYYELTDALATAEFSPGWERDIYPTQDFLLQSIEKKELYIGELEEKVVSCMVVNHEYNEGYLEIQWSVDAPDSELLVIHALGVHTAYSRQGLAKEMVRFVIDMAKKEKVKTIRLDVLEGNLPASKSYTKVGFEHKGTVSMFYEDTGWTNYEAYEYIVPQDAEIPFLTMGMCFGMTFGVVFGTLTGNLSVGMAIGICIGVVIGSMIDAKKKKEEK